MDSWNFICDGASSNVCTRKHGTPNKRWKVDFDNFLIPILVEKARKSLKCDKSFKQTTFAHAVIAVNARFITNFYAKNIENHYRNYDLWK